jgi:hypothetical protein
VWRRPRRGQGQALLVAFSLILLTKRLVIEHRFEYNRNMQLGDQAADQRTLHDLLDKINNDLTELITAVESGDLDQLSADER